MYPVDKVATVLYVCSKIAGNNESEIIEKLAKSANLTKFEQASIPVYIMILLDKGIIKKIGSEYNVIYKLTPYGEKYSAECFKRSEQTKNRDLKSGEWKKQKLYLAQAIPELGHDITVLLAQARQRVAKLACLC
jgi:DNA-binding PadR family transcriptional regulator